MPFVKNCTRPWMYKPMPNIESVHNAEKMQVFFVEKTLIFFSMRTLRAFALRRKSRFFNRENLNFPFNANALILTPALAQSIRIPKNAKCIEI